MSLCFDILLPTHDGERWLGEAVESVFAQSYQDWKLIAIDDCSSDGTRSILDALQRRDSARVQWIGLDRVHRAAGARMIGAAKGAGDVVAFLDQDDRWLPGKLERQAAAFASSPAAVAVHTDVEIVDRDGRRVPGAADAENANRARVDWSDRSATASALLANNRIRLVSSAVRREAFEAVGGFDASLFGGEDWHFWVRLAQRGEIVHLPEVLLQRRVHGENVTTVHGYARTQGRLRALGLLEAALPLPPDEVRAKRRRLLQKARDAAREEGHPFRALVHALQLARTRS